ncbi:hypothetical protein [Stanieria cyanosphaera]|uniref:hypothetical protein n=1 Tax=Stanieria cyanosphaera TaxID=102116 RepID=UPI0002FC4C40|nr:hypothetical protein [Stanieria cyanosphaera]
MYNSKIEAIIDEALKQDSRILDLSNNQLTYLKTILFPLPPLSKSKAIANLYFYSSNKIKG